MINTENLFRFRISGGEASLVSWQGGEDAEEAEIPETAEGCPVTSIRSYAFCENGAYLRKLSVPGSVRKIFPHAFELCISLSELTLGEGVREIGEDAFTGTALVSLSLPESLTVLKGSSRLPCRIIPHPRSRIFSSDGYGLYKDNVLAACDPIDSRSTYEIREGTEGIAQGVFNDRLSLKTVRIPASLENVPEGLFHNIRSDYSGETGIEAVYADPGNPFFKTEGDALIRKIDGGSILLRWFGIKENAVVPDSITEIGREAFAGRNVKYISLPADTRRAAPDAFRGCPLRELCVRDRFKVVFPDNNPYLLRDLLQGFGRNGKIYDFELYDRKLEKWSGDIERIEMMLRRLQNSFELDAALSERIRREIGTHLDDSVRIIAGRKRMDLLMLLCDLGLIADERLDDMIDFLSSEGAHEMAACVMRRKRTAGVPGFDYSL